ncbi:aldehyde dehydrogenase family protein [Mesonia sp. HuA40]|uniref:aldehyde dehydrogenase family protein n=1 Tax=Mesonia sp. HuA40 TaxID=2602761 RepID=UPI0011C89A22|nr:aldehyde dehydrogenase family protein [Mesonia sp. HuA40]TXK71021.1 aldehyde dehydrogenase family protein [Mesonia sp. HuA40]
MNQQELNEVFKNQSEAIASNESISVKERIRLLKNLKNEIQKKESSIIAALKEDFHKPYFETMLTEVLVVYKEINLFIKKLEQWSKPKKVKSSWLNFPSRAQLVPKAYGQVLIISPWNYPFQLAMNPLIGAIAAGNRVVLKPSEHSAATSNILATIIAKVFAPLHVKVVIGDQEVAQKLLQFNWNFIFFTGSTKVGRIIQQAAAKNLTPSVLELGGKNPCIVDETADIDLSAKRIAWGKFINAGQTCIAPDYILVQQKVKGKLIEAITKHLKQFYQNLNPESEDYAHIINEKHFNRLTNYLADLKVLYGGQYDETYRFIAPTLVDEPPNNHPILNEEIFGPILPILGFEEIASLKKVIQKNKNPLAGYIFSRNKDNIRLIEESFLSGGLVINDVLIHFVNDRLPFGGIAESGLGHYHGKNSFICFSHLQSQVIRKNYWDPPFRYPPYFEKEKWLQKIKKLFF